MSRLLVESLMVQFQKAEISKNNYNYLLNNANVSKQMF